MGNIYHEWDGTTLIVTSDSGTSSCDLKGQQGDIGVRGPQGSPGFSNINLDSTLSVEGAAADAKATGDRLTSSEETTATLRNEFNELYDVVNDTGDRLTSAEETTTTLRNEFNELYDIVIDDIDTRLYYVEGFVESRTYEKWVFTLEDGTTVNKYVTLLIPKGG